MYVLKIYDFEDDNSGELIEEQSGNVLDPLRQRLIYYVQNMINKRIEIFRIEENQKPVLVIKGRCIERNTTVKTQVERVIAEYKK